MSTRNVNDVLASLDSLPPDQQEPHAHSDGVTRMNRERRAGQVQQADGIPFPPRTRGVAST
jgi:hypothetical protein